MNKNIIICQHSISYYYEDQEMPDHEQEHVQDQIVQGYNQGELNCLMADDSENSGWWHIEK